LATLEGNGNRIELSEGQGVEVGLGMAIVDRFGNEPTPEPETEPEPEPTAKPLETFPILIDVGGASVRIKRPGSKRVEPLAKGEHTVEPGSEITLGTKDTANVKRGDATASLAGPGKYLVVGEGPRVVEPISGSMRISADGNDVAVDIPGGRVVALGSQGPAAGDISRSRGGAIDVRARVGKLRVEVGDDKQVLNAGQAAHVKRGKLTVSGRGPGFADIAISAGNSILVHDPNPPLAVGITATGCEHISVVERTKGGRVVGSAVGRASANLRFDAGRWGYRVRCLSETGALGAPTKKGSVTVYRDAGTRALPRKAPATGINADGRTYTVLYQNLLPAITVRWPNAPPAPSYKLSVTGPSGSKTLTSKTASYSFAAGKLKEGKHTFKFTSSMGRSSRSSRAVIRFDNAAPKGSISSPSEGGFAPNASVKVSGIALPGWSVVAQGTKLQMDSEQRFSQSVAAGPRGLVLRFSHPSRGTHHYLRRAAGVPR
jgi:hypothetical protein